MLNKTEQGLYYNDKLVARTYEEAIKHIFNLDIIKFGHQLNRSHKAIGYTVVVGEVECTFDKTNSSNFYNLVLELE